MGAGPAGNGEAGARLLNPNPDPFLFVDLTSYINSLSGAAGNVLGALNPKPQTTIVQAPAAAAPAASPLSKYLPWIIGGAVALVALLFISRR